MTDAMIASTLERLQKDVQASTLLMAAAEQVGLAMLLNRETDLAPGGHEAQAFITESLEHLVRRQALTLRDRARGRAAQLGWQVATYEIAPVAKDSGDDAVVFITGNSHMPPLRAFGVSDEVWQLESPDYWDAYVEGLESRLGELRVALECPEYDNSLYVVDLERFEHDDEGDPDTLSGEWKRISTD